ncbi:MAG: hypothetical protein ACK4WH_07465 [Phycisphaerales bacterium]
MLPLPPGRTCRAWTVSVGTMGCYGPGVVFRGHLSRPLIKAVKGGGRATGKPGAREKPAKKKRACCEGGWSLPGSLVEEVRPAGEKRAARAVCGGFTARGSTARR